MKHILAGNTISVPCPCGCGNERPVTISGFVYAVWLGELLIRYAFLANCTTQPQERVK